MVGELRREIGCTSLDERLVTTAEPALQAWPEIYYGLPSLLFPRSPHQTCAPPACDGWAAPRRPEEWDQPHPQWSAVLEGEHLRITRPGGRIWFKGPLLATRQWRRLARDRGTVLQITGPFAHPRQFPTLAVAGTLQLVLVPFALSGPL
ncbi:MAG: hypothetical protein JWR50_4395 [Mucilaginibacter sp.]|jgi:hypothetical protein|nr:hypothetical protein [Mucilaginibacter sp.]